jgi:putative ABC transport system substrate-binding protein
MGAKRLDLLHHLLPDVGTIAVLINPLNSTTEPQLSDISEAANKLALELSLFEARDEGDFDSVLAAIAQKGIGAFLITAEALFPSRRNHLVALAAQYGLPTMYYYWEFAAAGGLISYGPRLTEGARQAGAYAARILRGERPGDLPVMLPTKFELVINLETAKTLGLTIPPTLLALADEAIE